jgi:hypothetical protein
LVHRREGKKQKNIEENRWMEMSMGTKKKYGNNEKERTEQRSKLTNNRSSLCT